MGVREEVQKLIAAEKARSKAYLEQTQEFGQLLAERMRPLTAALREIVDAFPGNHVKLEEVGWVCRISVVRDPTNPYDQELRFDVELNRAPLAMELRAGWLVKETAWYTMPEHEMIEREHKLTSESDVCALILPRLVRKVAHYT